MCHFMQCNDFAGYVAARETRRKINLHEKKKTNDSNYINLYCFCNFSTQCTFSGGQMQTTHTSTYARMVSDKPQSKFDSMVGDASKKKLIGHWRLRMPCFSLVFRFFVFVTKHTTGSNTRSECVVVRIHSHPTISVPANVFECSICLSCDGSEHFICNQ